MSGNAWSAEMEGWARQHRASYQFQPEVEWFEAWEPFDTMVGAEHYLNAVSWSVPGGVVTVAEPWLAPLDGEPVARTLLAFVTHGAFQRRAAARVGEHFNTRVAFLQGAPMPEVKVGDRAWDAVVTTFAASPSEAASAFPPALRQLLLQWQFNGHAEVRPGGAVFHFAGALPGADQLSRLQAGLPTLLRCAAAT